MFFYISYSRHVFMCVQKKKQFNYGKGKSTITYVIQQNAHTYTKVYKRYKEWFL